MKYAGLLLAGACAGAMWLAVPAWAQTCPPDSVRGGGVCIDKYEASVWEIPASNKGLINKVQEGKATLANLQAGGAIPHGASSDDYGDSCPDSGNGCTDFYAVSIPGVLPSAYITWFQAQ